MTSLKAAVFSRDGLGDGLVALILANNLHLNSWGVDLYQRGICSELTPWISQIQFKDKYSLEEIDLYLKKYDRIFIFYCEKDVFTQTLIKKGKAQDNTKVTVLNPCFSKNLGNQPYYEDCLFDPKISIVKNMHLFCKNVLHLSKTTKHNGLVAPDYLTYKKHPKRICIHPTSSREGKNWPSEKFLILANNLKKKGF